jgi:hypothetical protein
VTNFGELFSKKREFMTVLCFQNSFHKIAQNKKSLTSPASSQSPVPIQLQVYVIYRPQGQLEDPILMNYATSIPWYIHSLTLTKLFVKKLKF